METVRGKNSVEEGCPFRIKIVDVRVF